MTNLAPKTRWLWPLLLLIAALVPNTASALERVGPAHRVSETTVAPKSHTGLTTDSRPELRQRYLVFCWKTASDVSVECNLYSYAGNNPVNFVDPTGLAAADDVHNFFKQGEGRAEANAEYYIGKGDYVRGGVWLVEGALHTVAKNLTPTDADVVAFGPAAPAAAPAARGVSMLARAKSGIARFFGRLFSRASTAGVLDNANFAQKTYGSMFSKGGKFAGQSVDDVAAALSSGKMKPSDVPIDYIVRDGNTLILNTRSAHALQNAGIPRSSWNAVDRTGQEMFENMLTGQLQRNKLTSEGTATVRRTGM